MFNSFSTTAMTIHYTGITTQKVGFDAMGVWSYVENDFIPQRIEAGLKEKRRRRQEFLKEYDEVIVSEVDMEEMTI
jgi:hypothetical protein